MKTFILIFYGLKSKFVIFVGTDNLFNPILINFSPIFSDFFIKGQYFPENLNLSTAQVNTMLTQICQ